MCGIAGIYSRHGVADAEERVRGMCRLMTHRGPDAEGFYRDQGLFMGMRRLSIIDLVGGHQPLYNEDQSLALIFNGEIYNYVELREELERRGHRFRTKSDGEVIPHLYEERGTDCLCQLNGMFGLCLWDRVRGRGLLARDHLGIKPLYYWGADGQLAFASELKCLLPVLPSVEADPDGIRMFLQHMYIPGPLSPIKGVRKLPPASWLEFSPDGVGDPKSFWDVPMHASAQEEPERDRFLNLMDDAARLQLRSDVPVGIFLSGGIDSSAVAAFSRKHMGSRVLCFTVRYDGNPVDEVAPATTVARHLNCEHHVTRVKTADAIALLPRLVWHLDEPHADSAMVGTYMVARTAADHVKVVLNGTGGDELFGGYAWYVGGSWRARILHHIPRLIRDGCVSLLRDHSLGRAVEAHRDRHSTFLWCHFQFSPRELSGFGLEWDPAFSPWKMASLLESAHGDPINQMLYTDLKSYLVDDLLLLLDKMAMQVSIEGRVPLLDFRIVEQCFRIPGSRKLPGTTLKSLLKLWLSGILPEEILHRPKWGFGAPVNHWMRDGLLLLAINVLDKRPANRGGLYWGLHGEALIQRIRNMSAQKVFALLTLELWFRIFLDGVSPDASIQDLAA